MDIKDSTITKYFLSLLKCFELNQLVDCPTYNKGHTLDIVISNGSFVSQLSTSDLGLPDHRAVFFNMELPDINTSSSRIINYRSLVDPVPSCLFKSCFDSLCPVVLSIINDSLCTGVVPAALKIAAVTPVPKTNNMDFDNLNNFHLISNLPFLAKILEQTVASQLLSHLSSNNLFEPL